MRTVFLLLALICTTVLQAQVSKVSLQASGLTCSMCSNSIYKSLKTLPFIDQITPNIKTSTFEIKFKPGSGVDFNQLKAKVEDAGYAVAKFVATVNWGAVKVKANEPVKVGSMRFQFVNAKDVSLRGEKAIKIVNKGFVSPKEFKKNAFGTPGAPDVYLAVI